MANMRSIIIQTISLIDQQRKVDNFLECNMHDKNQRNYKTILYTYKIKLNIVIQCHRMRGEKTGKQKESHINLDTYFSL